MDSRSSLSIGQRVAVIGLFEEGFGYGAASSRLQVSRDACKRLEQRFKIWGRAALERRPAVPSYSFEFKLKVVRQFLAAEATSTELAQLHHLSSPKLIQSWARRYRAEGEDALKPRPKGRPQAAVDQSSGAVGELEQLRLENQRLQAENAYLKKVRALRNQPPR